MASEKLIVLEFNELCPDLLNRWMQAGKLPNFKRLHDSSQVFAVQAETGDEEWLEPWIQWYSAHTGIGCRQHQVQHLTDGPRRASEITDIWHALLNAGLRVGNCGSMNAGGFQAPGSFYVPDPWCTTEPPYPDELAAYHRVVLSKVQENSSSAEPLSRKDYVDFLRFLSRHGLSSRSVLSVVGQLASERRDGSVGWKRAALLDQLQRDVFFHYWKRTLPGFSTFFLNSTAHFQHSYYHLAAPEKFDLPPSAFQDDAHRQAVLYGFQQMDGLIGDFLSLEARGARIVFMTALSQQPWERAGRVFYRPRDAASLLAEVGVRPARLLPVMAQQFSAEFASAEEADLAHGRMEQIRLGEAPLFAFNDAEPGTLFFGIALRTEAPAGALVSFPSNSRPSLPFHELCYRMPDTKMTVHHPRSMFWIRTGTHRVHGQPVSLLDIFPTFLDYFGAQAPSDPGFPRAGTSFLERIGINRYKRDPTALVA